MPTDVYANPELALAEDIGDLSWNPVGFVKYSYPWGEGELVNEGSDRPRAWQSEILTYIGQHLKNKQTRHTPCCVAVASGHGIGKSALIAWITHWAQSTCEDTKIVATANTKTQLDTKTVPEAQKWYRLGINAHWFEIKATSISIKDAEHAKLWRVDYIPWSDQNTEAFAGLHNKGKRIVLIFDEASAISDRIWEVAEGALTDENTEIIWLAFGNPTQNTGRFRECFGRFKHRWKTFQIDSRQVEGTNKAQIEKWIADYGEDSDFVRVRVRGEFPRAGSSQFIPSDVVASARSYKASGYESLPKVLSCDVARFGDDQTVVGTRQGRRAIILAKYRGLDTVQIALRVMEWQDKEEPDATIIDSTGLGAGVIDNMRYRGRNKRLFEYAPNAAARDSAKYRNARAEMWGKMRDWLAAGAEIPDDPELEQDLTGPEYFFSAKDQIQIEQKEDIKKRGLASPDTADMLAMTFQVDVAAPQPKEPPVYRYPGQVNTEWMS